jgi:hypothetical protein
MLTVRTPDEPRVTPAVTRRPSKQISASGEEDSQDGGRRPSSSKQPAAVTQHSCTMLAFFGVVLCLAGIAAGAALSTAARPTRGVSAAQLEAVSSAVAAVAAQVTALAADAATTKADAAALRTASTDSAAALHNNTVQLGTVSTAVAALAAQVTALAADAATTKADAAALITASTDAAATLDNYAVQATAGLTDIGTAIGALRTKVNTITATVNNLTAAIGSPVSFGAYAGANVASNLLSLASHAGISGT